MQNYSELNMQLCIRLQDKPTYQNLHHLLSEGHRLPLQGADGEAIGYAVSCTLHDKPGYEENGKVSVSTRFVMTKNLAGVVVDVLPLMIIYHFNKKEMFKILSHFVVVVSPVFKTKF